VRGLAIGRAMSSASPRLTLRQGLVEAPAAMHAPTATATTLTRFEAIGAYLPSRAVSTRSLVEQMRVRPPFDLEEITGIENRRVHDHDADACEGSLGLALAAARDCLSRSRYRPEDLDLVVSVSITRYRGGHRMYFEPSFALTLKKALGAKAAIHFDLSNACAGMFSGVLTVDRMIKAGLVKNGLVVSGECITPISDTALEEIDEVFDPQFGSLTVGDAGAAVILDASVGPEDCIHYVELMTSAEHSGLCLGMPSDQGTGPALYTNNQEMHRKERVQLWPHFQRDFLRKRGTTFESEKYDYLVHHQVGTKAMANFSKFASKIFECEMPPGLSVVEQYGNTASTSHFVVLHEHLRQKKLPPGTKLLFVPAASGLVTGCVAATISSLSV
jgi:3-oxoacyl-[acyl-carrier-protein] synthase III